MNFNSLYINGQWCDSMGDDTLRIENPATGDLVATVPNACVADLDKAVGAARAAFNLWSKTPLVERVALMEKMLAIFQESKEEIAQTITAELGSPIKFSRSSQVDYQFTRVQSYIDICKELVLEEKLPLSTVYRKPVGVIACITPWNYPLGQIVQKVIPAILMGNTVIIKPAQLTPLAAYYLVDAFDRAGFPEGVINLLVGTSRNIGDALADHPRIDMISFTGSTEIGIKVSQRALCDLKRISMELGGKSACIVLPEADERAAIKMCFNTIFLNSGQTCTALSRIIIPADRKDSILTMMKEMVQEYKVGDPLDEETDIGTVASSKQFFTIAEYIRKGLKSGAQLLVGSIPKEENGLYVHPTIFYDVENTMRIAQDEIFGPVLCVLTYDTVEEAIELANSSQFGLSGAVWGPKEEAIRVAKEIRTGNVYINDGPRDVLAPFGGFKKSGIGREAGREGLFEFTELQALFDHCAE